MREQGCYASLKLNGPFQSLVNLQLKVFSDDLKPGGREQSRKAVSQN